MKVRQDSNHPFIDVGLLGSDVDGDIADLRSDLNAETNARTSAISAEAEARQAADNTLQSNINSEASTRQTTDNMLQSNINSEASARANADNALQSQINQIIAPTGEAPSAAEVENARVGADGTTYTNLGTAIRTQVEDANEAIHGGIAAFSEKDYNANLALVSSRQYSYGGVTYMAKDGIVTVTGSSTVASSYDLFTSLDATPFPFIPGKTYRVKYTQSNAEQLYVQVQYQQTSGGTWTTYWSSDAQDGAVVFTMPLTFARFVIRLTCSGAGHTYNKTVSFEITRVIPDGFGAFDTAVLDAAKTGYIDYSNFFQYRNTRLANYRGVSITDDGDTITLSGTGTLTGTYMLLEDKGNQIFKPNDRIVIEYTDPADNVYLECVTKSGATTHSPMLQTMHSGVYIMTFPAVFDYCRINLLIINGTAYNTTLTVKVRSANLSDAARTIVVAKDGTGDYTKLKDAVEDAVTTYGTTVIVKPGTYDLVEEYGKSYLDALTGGDYGLMLGNGINLKFAPTAYVTFNYDGANDWVTENFSPFNTSNDLGFTIDGMHCTAQYCRYILHDDPRPGAKNRYSYNVIKNCYLEMYPATSYTSWVNHQIIGGGLGDSTSVVIENCIFDGHYTTDYEAVSYHNSTSGSASYESKVTVKDNFFADGNQLKFMGYGSAAEKTKVIVANNSFEDYAQDFAYSHGSDDNNMIIYAWGNVSRI